MTVTDMADIRPADRDSMLKTAAVIGAAGLAGLLVWEIFATQIAPLVMGGPLQPTGLIRGLFANFLGLPISAGTASALHYATGLVFYPLGYLVMTRVVDRAVPLARHLVWFAMLGFIALMSVDWAGPAVVNPVGTFLGLNIVAFAWLSDRLSAGRAYGNGLMLGVGTWILALGVFVSLAGMPFMLNWGTLTWMSLIGHGLYGLAVALVVERFLRG